jgi:hypothetical protein
MARHTRRWQARHTRAAGQRRVAALAPAADTAAPPTADTDPSRPPAWPSLLPPQLQLECVHSSQHVTALVLQLLAAMRRSLQQPSQLWRKVGLPQPRAAQAKAAPQGAGGAAAAGRPTLPCRRGER